MILLILVILFIVLCLFRIPIPFAMGISSLIMIFYLGVSPQQMVIQLYKGIQFFPLLAVPFFLLVGVLLNEAKITEDLIRVAQAIVGRIKGGLAHVNVLASMIFGGVSGSSTSDTAAIGAVMIPAMEKEGYKASFAAAITAASSTMGNIIPPSIYMIIYGALAAVSIEGLFLAGIIPGILIGLTQMLYSYWYAKKNGIAEAEKIEFSATVKAIINGVPALLVVFLIVGGITFGWFTATEASVIAAVYTLFLVLVYYRTVKVKHLPRIFFDTTKTFSAILFTIGTASVFGFLVAYLGGAELVSNWLAGISTNPIVLLLFIAGILLIVGTFMSEIATIIIFMPVFLEVQALGNIDPIHMGIVVIMTLCLGLVTPPYGMCLHIAKQISSATTFAIVVSLVPLILVFLVVVFLIIIFPQISLFVPNLLLS